MIDDKKIKIVVFYRAELTQRAIDDMALDELAQWFDLEFWDCRAVHWPNNPPAAPNRVINRSYVHVIRSVEDLETHLEKLPSDTIGFIYMLQNPPMYKIHKLIASRIACAVFYSLNVNDSVAGELEQTKQVTNIGLVSQDRNIIVRLLMRLKHQLYSIDAIYLMSMYVKYRGNEEYYLKKLQVYRRKICRLYKKIYSMGVSPFANLRTSHPDYDKILKLGNMIKYREPYFVYIDESYMDSLDAKERFPNVCLDSMRQSYYNSINRFFDMVEHEYNCKVLIALHPTTNLLENPFEGRECFQYKTVELVKDCSGVILHASNAINFIAYYDKPICYVYNEVLSRFDFEGSLFTLGQFQCRQLGLPFVNMEELDIVKGLFHHLKPEIRKAVVNKYFGDISRGIPNSEILKEHFEKIYSEMDNN